MKIEITEAEKVSLSPPLERDKFYIVKKAEEGYRETVKQVFFRCPFSAHDGDVIVWVNGLLDAPGWDFASVLRAVEYVEFYGTIEISK